MLNVLALADVCLGEVSLLARSDAAFIAKRNSTRETQGHIRSPFARVIVAVGSVRSGTGHAERALNRMRRLILDSRRDVLGRRR